MRLNKVYYGFLLIGLLIFITNCSTPARYTYEEIKHFPLDVQERIMKGEVALGMTPQQVRYAWGAPNYIRVLEPLSGKPREEWIYTMYGIYESRRLLFIDGKLTYIIPEMEKTKDKESK